MADRNLFISSLCAGGIAGFTVDVVLFPLDTLKTRLQAAQGFWKSGGFKGVYTGIGPQAIGSAPQAALFFCAYEGFKATATPLVPSPFHPFVHMIGASFAEVISCIVRVPVEVVKQRRQTCMYLPPKSRMSSMKIAIQAYKTEGVKGLYRGFGSTVIREVPFSFIQFPILEYLKKLYSEEFKKKKELEPWEVAICGSIAGGTSAAITTPLDVIKTRIMLTPISIAKEQPNALKISYVVRNIYKESGIKGLFAGFVPRVVWITLGGYIFFGMYDLSKHVCTDYLLGKDYKRRS